MGSMLKQTPLAEHRAQAKYPVHRIMKKNSKRKARNEKTFSCFPFLFQGMLSTFTSNRIYHLFTTTDSGLAPVDTILFCLYHYHSFHLFDLPLIQVLTTIRKIMYYLIQQRDSKFYSTPKSYPHNNSIHTSSMAIFTPFLLLLLNIVNFN